MFCVDDKKQHVAILNGSFDCEANLRGQLGLACAGKAAGIPYDKRLSAARADSRDPIARYPRSMVHHGANEDDGIARDDKDWEPCRESPVIRINLAPAADAQRDDAAQKQAFVSNWIENDSE